MDRSSRVSSLFDARLRVPRPPASHVQRRRITDLIDHRTTAAQVTLVTGGAGSGKTLAVAQWALGREEAERIAWLSLDRSLTNPARLWRGIVRAVRDASDIAEPLVVPDVVDEEFVESFVDWVAPAEVVLILDDLQDLDGSEAWDSLDHLLRLIPRRLRLVLIARHDPPLLLHRLRLAGQVGEIRASDLAFTHEEVGELLKDRGLDLPETQVGVLLEMTEGWPAGLRLAIMSLESAPDPVSAVAEFSGHQALVAGYLVDEVIRGLGEVRATFLLRTCVTDQVCGPLARALTADRSSAKVLEEMARDNALVTELRDSGWYRYHPLMRQMLRARLHVENPELERELHRTASAWYESRDEWRSALEHAVAAEEWDLVGRLTLRSAAVLLFSADRSALAALSDRVPVSVAHRNPELLLSLALAAFSRREHEIETALVASANTLVGELPEPRRSIAQLNLHVLAAISARRAGNASEMADHAAAASRIVEELRPEDAPGWVAYRGAPQALAAIGEVWSGRPSHAEALLLAALSQSDRSRFEGYAAVYHQGQYALAEVVLGRIASARAIALRALETAEQMGARFRVEAGAAWLALAAAEVQRGDVAATGRALDFCALATDSARDPFVAVGLDVVAVRRALLLADVPAARRHLGAIQRRLVSHPGMRHVARLHLALSAETDLTAGLTQRARALLAAVDADEPRDSEPDDGEPDVLAVPRARVLLATGHPEDVRPTVEQMLGAGGTVGGEAWLVLALAEDRLRRDAAAGEAFTHALDLAAAEDAVLPFLRPRDRLGGLLRRHLDVVGTHRGLVDRILAVGSDPDPGGDVALEPLTDREVSVLVHLPTMSSNVEIADALGISVNTVKQHLKAINRKLGVSSRRDAVRVARRFGLMPAAAPPN